ncbi:MAG: transporter substrate-binding domain-containing protein [Pseudomonadota bacterium]
MLGSGLECSFALAQNSIRVAVDETLDYPLTAFNKKHQLSGGLLKDFTDRLAARLGTGVTYLPFSRRRAEASLLRGESDLLCYFGPQWSANPAALAWSAPNLVQIERVVVRSEDSVPENFPQDLKNKKIALRLGYHYALIQHLFDTSLSRRIDQTNVPSMFKLLELGGADVFIMSEGEIEGYYKSHPEKRARFKLSKTPFSIVYTKCAISARSHLNIEHINKAILRMQESGELERMSRQYGLGMH